MINFFQIKIKELKSLYENLLIPNYVEIKI